MTRPRDSALANAIVCDLGAQPTATREIVGLGTVNHVFVVSLATGKTWVVRFGHDPLNTNVYAKEAWCLEAAARHGIPGPKLVAHDEFEGVPFIVQTFIDGLHAHTQRDRDLWRTLGRYARIVNHIPLDSTAPDDLFDRFGRDPLTSWLAHLQYNLDQLTPDDPLIGLEVYARSEQHAIRACIEGLREQVHEFGLTHGDLVPQNILQPPQGLPTLIDWGSARVGPVPFHDYLRIWADEGFSPGDFAAFAEGYGIAPEHLLSTMVGIHLLSKIDLVRWALDRRPDRLVEIAASSRLTVNRWLHSSQ